MRQPALEKKATSKSYKLYVAIVVTLNIIPHCFDLPAWLIIIAAIFIIWSILNIYRNFKLPSVLFRNILVGISSAFIFMNYKTIFGPEPASAIFVIVAAVKLVDFTKYRDGMTEIILCYFLLLTHLLHSQSLGTTLFFTFDVFVITTLMHQLHKNDRRQSIRTFLPSLKMLFLAIPIWIFLFVVFPRFSASLIHVKPPQAATGFSEKLAPGSISQLLQSDDNAFHVKFDQDVVPERLYFRGGVLSHSEGLSWKKSEIDDRTERPGTENTKITTSANSAPIRQEITLEPVFQKYLFALDFPLFVTASESTGIIQKTGRIYELRYPLQNRGLYTADSTNHNYEKLRPEDRRIYLQIPEVSEEVKTLSTELVVGTKTTRQKVAKILNYFSSHNFRYSLDPGKMSGDQLKTFLFEKKIGFCEHFAATFSTLIRMMGVPSRVVVGFQGGKYNELTGYYLVKTSDAHAWSEVWSDEDHEWLRIDPTAVIAPVRIAFGADAYRQGLSRASVVEAQNSVGGKINSNIFFALDAITTKWNNFLLKYDFEYQNKLLEDFGFKNSRMTLFILLFAGLAALTAALKIYFASQKTRIDKVLSIYHQFCRKLEPLGITRQQTEGPEQLLIRASQKLPARRAAIETILRSFIRIRYNSQREPADIKALKNLINRF